MGKKQEKQVEQIPVYEVQILVEEEMRLIRVTAQNVDIMDAGDVAFSDENNITAFFSSAVLIAFYRVDPETGAALSVEELTVDTDPNSEEEVGFDLDGVGE